MPILSKTGIVFQISDLAGEVIQKVENRTTDLVRAYAWLKDSLIEIAGNSDYRDEFVELEVFGPTFTLTGGTKPISSGGLSVQEYSELNLLPAGDINMSTLDVMIWRDPPTNSTRQKLQPSHYQEADKSVVITSVPTSWYRFGGNIGFYPSPDKNYQIQSRVLIQHPIADAAIQTTQILLPREWNEILVMAAVEKGFIELGEYEKAGSVHTLLYGDPRYPGKPGMVNGRKKKRGREAWRTTGRLQPIIGNYVNR